MQSSNEIHTVLNCGSLKILTDLVDAVSTAPIECSRTIARELQAAIEETELTKESYHSVSLLIELLFKVYLESPALLQSEWVHLITFSTCILSEATKEKLTTLIFEKKKTKITEKPAAKQKLQLNEYLNMLFLSLMISHINLSDQLAGFLNVIESIQEDLQSTSMEITSLFFQRFTSKIEELDVAVHEDKTITPEVWTNTTSVFSMMCSTLEKKNLETDGAENARIRCFVSAHALFKLGISICKANPDTVDSTIIALLDSIKHLCGSKIGNTSTNYGDLLLDFKNLAEFLVAHLFSQQDRSTQLLPGTFWHDLIFKALWYFIFFMLQGEALDLTISTKILKTFLFNLHTDRLRQDEKLKLLQVVGQQ